LRRPIVGSESNRKGSGYWLVASDGGVFTYGRAGFYGSTGRIRLHAPVLGMERTGSAKGYWLSAYDGVSRTDPAELEVDHVVALKEAHDSGAGAWQSNRLVAFGNDLDDPRSLRAVTAAVNGAKGDADPSNWLPPDEAQLCTYLGDWIAIKARWSLSMDQSEHGRIGNLLTERCPGHAIAPWPDAPPDPPPPPPTTPPPTTPPPPPMLPPSPPQPPAGNCTPGYEPCLPPADDYDCSGGSGNGPEYTGTVRVTGSDPYGLDNDGDGVGCE